MSKKKKTRTSEPVEEEPDEPTEEQVCEITKRGPFEDIVVPIGLTLGLSWLIELLLHHARGSIPFITEEENEEFVEDRKRRGIIAIIIAGIVVFFGLWYLYSTKTKGRKCDWVQTSATRTGIAIAVLIVIIIIYHRFSTDGINSIPPPAPDP